jgi:hypothetical protein
MAIVPSSKGCHYGDGNQNCEGDVGVAKDQEVVRAEFMTQRRSRSRTGNSLFHVLLNPTIVLKERSYNEFSLAIAIDSNSIPFTFICS